MTTDNNQSLAPVYSQVDLRPTRGDGAFIFTADGRKFLDMYGGHATALLGYNHPVLVETLAKQASDLFFQSNVVPLDVRERAADDLLSFAPDSLTSVFFVNSGAEANENALRLACRHTGRNKVICVDKGFHGRTAAAAALTDGSERWYGFPTTPFNVTRVSRDDPQELESAIDEGAAAVIFEPVQGIGGAFALSKEYLETARRCCDQTGAVLIFDEVQCGMGRCGHPFVAQKHGIDPDLLTTGKGLAGGFPAAALLLNNKLAHGLSTGDMGSTFGGGPMACALISAVIGTISKKNLLHNVLDVSEYLRAKVTCGPVEAVHGEGFLIGLRTTRPAKEVRAELLANDVLVGGSSDPNIVRLLPPLILSIEHVDAFVEKLAALPS